MQTKIDLCSEALLKIGENAITSFNDDSAAAQISGKLYDIIADNLLCLHTWRFALKKYTLTKLVNGDFLIPTDILRVIACDCSRYEVMQNKIICDTDKIEITGIARVNTEDFPSYFVAPLVTKLAMEFCIPLTGNQNSFAILNALFENEIRTAKFIDSASSPNQTIGNFSLISARF